MQISNLMRTEEETGIWLVVICTVILFSTSLSQIANADDPVLDLGAMSLEHPSNGKYRTTMTCSGHDGDRLAIKEIDINIEKGKVGEYTLVVADREVKGTATLLEMNPFYYSVRLDLPEEDEEEGIKVPCKEEFLDLEGSCGKWSLLGIKGSDIRRVYLNADARC